MRRWSAQQPCPVCGGHAGLPRGEGTRCYGFMSGDGAYAHCTREQLAGPIEPRPGSGTFAHIIAVGRCHCGTSHDVAPKERPHLPNIGDAAERSRLALNIWRAARPARGTIAETYLRHRGIGLPVPDSIRFAPALKHVETDTYWPAMVALVVSVNGNPAAIHRTFLDGTGRKAPVQKPKKALGPVRGGAVRLAAAGEQLVIAEGIETALAAAELSGLPAWAALSAAGIAGLELPDEVLDVVIASDRDDAGRVAAWTAARRWRAEGRKVAIYQPEDGYNDYAELIEAKRG